MTPVLARATTAELTKLCTLPIVLLTIAGTIVSATGLTATMSAAATAFGAVDVVGQTVPFIQAGLLLLGVLAAATEYSGGQIAITLAAVPQRVPLLAGKTLACLIMAAITGVATIAAAFLTSTIVLQLRGGSARVDEPDRWPLIGMVVYLMLIGLLAFALALLLRALIAPLVTMLTLVMVLSPLVASHTDHARWLPDRAGMLCYQPAHDAVLGPVGGALVLVGWVVVGLLVAGVMFVRRDASP